MTIECADKDIVIEEPQVTLTEGQGMKSFTIMGRISEVDKTAVEISDEDVKLVKEQSGIRARFHVRRHGQSGFDGPLGQQPGRHHHRWIARVRATGDGGNNHVAMRHPHNLVIETNRGR